MNVQLVRHAYLTDVTLGWLIVGDLRLATLEEPWGADPNGPGGQRAGDKLTASCVPDGTYRLEPHSGTKHRDVWALANPQLGVWHWPDEIPKGQSWGRSANLIHVANSLDDIEGCIAAGLFHHRVNAAPYVSNSAKAIDRLRLVLGTTTVHQLTIRPTAGTAEAA